MILGLGMKIASPEVALSKTAHSNPHALILLLQTVHLYIRVYFCIFSYLMLMPLYFIYYFATCSYFVTCLWHITCCSMLIHFHYYIVLISNHSGYPTLEVDIFLNLPLSIHLPCAGCLRL